MSQSPDHPVRFPNGAYVYTRGPLDAYAWPGGYPIAYYPVDEHGCTVGDVICAGCANAEADAGFDYANDAGFIAQIIEEAHNTEYCDNCSDVIAYQNWCDFCQDSVDCDESNPIHTCKPRKWLVTTHYDRHPSTKPFHTRQEARDYRNSFRYARHTRDLKMTISPIVPPIMPDN